MAVSLLVAAFPESVAAQRHRLAVRLCTTCQLRVSHLLRMGDVDGPGSLADAVRTVAVDRFGNYYVVEYVENWQILVFDAAGRHLRTVGRSGQGPGEYRRIDQLAIHGDTLFVIDPGNRRITKTTLEGVPLQHIDIQAANVFRVAQISPRDLLMAAVIPTRERAGLPLHVVDLETGAIRSFGDENPVYRPAGPPHLNMRVISLSTSGQVWSARRTAYELELWNAGHESRVLGLFRDVEWFKPHLERPVGTADPPPAWLSDIKELDAQTLAALIVVPVDNYTEVLGPKRLIDDFLQHDYSRLRELFDTVIEIIDVSTRTVIKSERVDQYLDGFIPGASRVYAIDNVDGVPVLDILTFAFNRGMLQ